MDDQLSDKSWTSESPGQLAKNDVKHQKVIHF